MQALTSILGTLASAAIPVEDYTVKSLCGQVITQGLNASINNSSRLEPYVSWFTGRCNEVLVKQGTPMYEKIEQYIVRTHLSKFRTCELVAKRGAISFSLHGRFLPMDDSFDGCAIRIETVQEATNVGDEPTVTLCIASRDATMQQLKDYVNGICDFDNSASNVLKVYKAIVTPTPTPDSSDKKRHPGRAEWEEIDCKTNKTIANTIVSDSVRRDLLEDVSWFLSEEGERWHNEKGIPYKRGFALHGPPGTGKTSIIKAIANRYSMAVFVIDLAILEDANQLSCLVSQATYMANNKPHVLALEDIDRTKIFDRWNSPVGMSSFLNIIDGVVETYGRILIMTANDIGEMQREGALMRPGRIDKIVHMGNFGTPEVLKMLEGFYGPDDAGLRDGREFDDVTPADLIKVIQEHLDDEEAAVDALVKESGVRGEAVIVDGLQKKSNAVCSLRRGIMDARKRIKRLEKDKANSQKFLDVADEKIRRGNEKLQGEIVRLVAARERLMAAQKREKRKAPPPNVLAQPRRMSRRRRRV